MGERDGTPLRVMLGYGRIAQAAPVPATDKADGWFWLGSETPACCWPEEWWLTSSGRKPSPSRSLRTVRDSVG
jgi:hypothetical protein